jgi:hypothetical protein
MLGDLLVSPEEGSVFEGACVGSSDFMLEEDILPESGGKVEFLVVACMVVMV